MWHDVNIYLCWACFNLTHLIILFCPSEKEIDFFTAPLVFEERSIGVGSFVVQLWRSSSSSLTGRQEEEDSRSIPESMLPASPLPTSTPLSLPPMPLHCRLVLAPTHRRSLVFRLDLPSPLSLSLFASRSTTVELSRVGLWVSARVNTGILEIFDACSPNSRFWRWPWDLGVSEAKDQVFRSSEYICQSLSSIKILLHKVSVSVAGLCSALCPEKLTGSSIESNTVCFNAHWADTRWRKVKQIQVLRGTCCTLQWLHKYCSGQTGCYETDHFVNKLFWTELPPEGWWWSK